MTIKQKLLADIDKELPDALLEEVYQFVQRLKQANSGNRDEVLIFAGMLSDSDALAMKQDRAETFSRLEGEW